MRNLSFQERGLTKDFKASRGDRVRAHDSPCWAWERPRGRALALVSCGVGADFLLPGSTGSSDHPKKLGDGHALPPATIKKSQVPLRTELAGAPLGREARLRLGALEANPETRICGHMTYRVRTFGRFP